MTEQEVLDNMKSIIAIEAKGLLRGYQFIQIIEYDFSKRTIWGKGVVAYKCLDNPNKRINACLTQVELYDGEIIRNNKRKTKRIKEDLQKKNKKDSLEQENIVKRNRKRKRSRRTRKRNV